MGRMHTNVRFFYYHFLTILLKIPHNKLHQKINAKAKVKKQKIHFRHKSYLMKRFLFKYFFIFMLYRLC